MKNILLTVMLLTGISASLSAEGVSASSEPTRPAIRPAIKPAIKPITRPAIRATMRPARRPTRRPRRRPIIQYHYITTIQTNCNKYIDIIKAKDKEIEALSKEIDNLREEKYEGMQQRLKEEHDKEMRKFEERGK